MMNGFFDYHIDIVNPTVLLVLSTHVYHQDLYVAWINSTYTTSLTKRSRFNFS
jgi:hypothetical protein